ncbi:hypothetical protein HDU97_003214 [Phlyctochytrium planicorne]|nr:hypothetical protein HDU97_003214 [Phlyctochytrium planicorne]
MALLHMLRSVPLEVYPLMGMMMCGLSFGGYVATKAITRDQDLRFRFDKQAVHQHWIKRVNGGL